MNIQKYNKDQLKELDTRGYKIIPCKEDEQKGIYDTLKADKRCARAGYIFNKDNEKIFFVLTKERVKTNEKV